MRPRYSRACPLGSAAVAASGGVPGRKPTRHCLIISNRSNQAARFPDVDAPHHRVRFDGDNARRPDGRRLFESRGVAGAIGDGRDTRASSSQAAPAKFSRGRVSDSSSNSLIATSARGGARACRQQGDQAAAMARIGRINPSTFDLRLSRPPWRTVWCLWFDQRIGTTTCFCVSYHGKDAAHLVERPHSDARNLGRPGSIVV